MKCSIRHLSRMALILIFLSHSDGMLIAQQKISLTSSTIEAIEARHIGPATMSGRISALDAVVEDPRIIYVGSAGGGVWKSFNGGTKFKPIFDKYNQCIGAITIDQQHPDTVWVGTGEPWTRNSVSVGDGIYRTTDGGDNWKKMGLEKTERIARIVIHPENSDILWVAALGHLWNSNEERGVYKTSDGGKTWVKLLYIDENTGCADIAVDPQNPEILYAGMWDFRRQPWTFRSGGPGSGLYKTTDGGETWDRLTNGLPEGELGRIAVTVSPVTPNLVYALVESKESALYRSLDSGESWEKMNTTIPVQERPFYFSLIVADPVDTNRIYKPSFDLNVSENGGKNFRIAYIAGGNVHSDLHAFWVGKKDNNLLYVGTDGGVYVSRDKGSSWSIIRNLPVSQFYHVSVDLEKPYHVYGGLQDNGSWKGPSEKAGGISNAAWVPIGMGDGFYMFPDLYDKDIVYWQAQGGMFGRYHKNTGEIKFIAPAPDETTDELRFNWNAAVAFSPTHDVMYVGGQYLFQSKDKGDTWKRISPDLTTNDPEKQRQFETGGLTLDNSTAENHCTIFAIEESPKNPSVIWAGADDGNLQVTRDEGKSWSNVTPNVPGLPEYTWCSFVYASTFAEGTAFVTFDGHRTGDMTPYLYKTTDFGKTWKSLIDENVKGYCHTVHQDLVNPNLVFLGTEFGLFVTFDDGEQWIQMKGNIPNVSIRDMVIHPREHDLVLATHGRGVFIVDDVTPLRMVTEELLQEDVAFLESQPFVIKPIQIGQAFPGDDEFSGDNPPDVAMPASATITYYLKRRHVFGDMYLEVYDSEGILLSTIPAGKRKGINRVPWSVMKKPPNVPSSPSLAQFALFGPYYNPGEYRIKLVKGDESYEGSLVLKYDEDSPHSLADRQLNQEMVNKGYNLLEELAFVDRKATFVMEKARGLGASDQLKKSIKQDLNNLADTLEGLHQQMVATKMGGITGEELLREKITMLYASSILYQGKPSQTVIDGLDFYTGEVERMDNEIEEVLKDGLAKVNAKLEKAGSEPIEVLTREQYLKESKE